VHAQTDTLNRTDEKGHKTGWWITFLDKNLKELPSSQGATHCKYAYFHQRFNTYNMGPLGTKDSPVEFPPNDTLTLNGYKLLNGEYVARYQNGKIRYRLNAMNGVLLLYEEFFSNGALKTRIDYSPTCGRPVKACIETWNKQGKKKRGYTSLM